jgi:hypothetical protein
MTHLHFNFAHFLPNFARAIDTAGIPASPKGLAKARQQQES